jgi:adenylate cyclase
LVRRGEWDDPRTAAAEPVSRTLTVLFADLKDFTSRAALSSRRELMTIVRAHRRIAEQAVTRHGGRIVKEFGDGLLADFESATEAVLAGLAMQAAAAAHNATAPPDDRIGLRIALATGEVTVEDGDVYGPSVNVAARLQGLAPAGDVYVSESTRHAVASAEVSLQLIGTFELKGIDTPTQVYRAELNPKKSSEQP